MSLKTGSRTTRRDDEPEVDVQAFLAQMRRNVLSTPERPDNFGSRGRRGPRGRNSRKTYRRG